MEVVISELKNELVMTKQENCSVKLELEELKSKMELELHKKETEMEQMHRKIRALEDEKHRNKLLRNRPKANESVSETDSVALANAQLERVGQPSGDAPAPTPAPNARQLEALEVLEAELKTKTLELAHSQKLLSKTKLEMEAFHQQVSANQVRYDEILSVYKDLVRKYSQLKDEYAELQKASEWSITQAQHSEDKTKIQLRDFDKEREVWERKKQELVLLIERQRNTISSLEERLEKHPVHLGVAELRKQVAEFRNQVIDRTRDLEQTRTELNRVKAEMAEGKSADILVLTERITDLVMKNATLTQELDKAKQSLQAKEERLVAMDEDLTEMTGLYMRLKAERSVESE